MNRLWQATLLLLASWILCLPSHVRADFIADKLKSDVTLATNEVKVLLVVSDNLNPQVNVVVDENLLHSQKGPDAVLNREFLVLGPFAEQTQVSIQVDIGYDVGASGLPSIIELNDLSDTEINVYRQLSKASQLWRNPPQRLDAINRLNTFINDKSLTLQISNELTFMLAAMLMKTGKTAQAAKLIDGLEFEAISDKRGLTAGDFQLLTAQISYWSRDFEQAVIWYCQYFNSLNAQVLKASTQLLIAQNIIEQQRGHKKDHQRAFLPKYVQHCQPILAEVYGKNQRSVEQYLTAEYQPIADAKAILNHLLANIKHNWAWPVAKSQILGQLWNYHTVMDQHLEAEKVSRLAIDIHQRLRIDNPEHLASYYWYLGTSLQRQGQVSQAQRVLRKGLMATKDYSDQSFNGTSLFNLAYSYRSVGEYPLAQRYFEKTLIVDEQSEGPLEWQKGSGCNKQGIYSAMTVVQLGALARFAGNLDDALLMQQCAEAVFDNTNEYYALLAKLEIGEVLFALGKIDDAKRVAEKVLKDKRVMAPQQLDGLLLMLQSIVIENGNVEPIARQLVSTFGYKTIDFDIEQIHQNYPVRQIKFYQLLIRYYAQQNDAKNIQQFGEKAIKLIETIKAQVLNTQAWSAAQFGVLAEYIKALYQTDSGAHLAKIFSLLDSYYSINLDVERNTYHADVSQQILPQTLEDLWFAKLAAQREFIAAKPEQKAQAQQLLDEANEQYLAYGVQSAQPIENKIKAKLSITQFQQRMPSSDIFVRYFVDDELSFALVLTKERFYIHPIADKLELNAQVEDLRSNFYRRDIRQFVIASPLTQLLPMVELGAKQYQRLVIVADDVLHQLPFSLLNVATGGQYRSLGSQIELVRTHSARRFYASANTRDGKQAGHIALFADPDFADPQIEFEHDIDSKGFRRWLNARQRLPYTVKEAVSIVKSLNSQVTAHLATGKAATNQFLLSAVARKASILHIATHGYYDPKTPNIVGILTSSASQMNRQSSGFLGLDELLSHPFYSDLVVISGCETMVGQYYQGSGNKSITRGFLAKGANSVIATLWKVADGPTALFMTTFYRHLQATQGDTARALMLTKQQFAQRGRYRHPKYWAGFVLTSVNQNISVSL